MSQTQSLRWGDLVRIHGVVTNSKSNMPKGLIIAKGFTDSNLYYQTYGRFQQVNFYRESLFQIIPKSNFDQHDNYLKNQKTQKKSQQSSHPSQQEQKICAQIQNFQNQLKLKAGKQILYGSQVVFRHVQSQQYLCGMFTAADIGEGAFKLSLRTDLCSEIIFQIKSHRTYEHQGNNVYFDDCLQLYHIRSDCYVNFPPDTNSMTYLDKEIQAPIEPAKNQMYNKYYEKRPKIKKPQGNVRISIINQNKPKCLWKFIKHCSYVDYLSKQKIKSHDIVYFQHTKNKGLVASSLADQKYYLKQFVSSNQNQGPSYQCFWQLIPKQVNQYGPQSCNIFWARNIVTGQILTHTPQNSLQYLQQDPIKIQIQSKQKIQGGGFQSGGLIHLICSQNQKLQRGQPIQLDQNLHMIEKYFEEKIQKRYFKMVDSLPQDSFVIVKVEDQTIRDVAYVLSSHQYLVKFVEIFSHKMLNVNFIQLKSQKKGLEKVSETYKKIFLQLDEDFLKNVIKILKLLCGKIYQTQFDQIQISGNLPIPRVQKILVQTGIPLLLIQMIFLLFQPFQQIQRNNQPSQDKAIRLRLAQIFQLSYKLLQKMSIGYQDNRIYLSRWIQLFLSHAKQINKSFIQQTLVCILQNNPVSIQYNIDNQKIQQLIKKFLQQAIKTPQTQFLTTKYIRLFSTFIKCDDLILKQNQSIILNKFFNRQDNKFTFRFKVEYRAIEQIQQQQQILQISQVNINHQYYAGNNFNNFNLNSILDDNKLKEKSKIVKVSFGKEQYVSIPEFYKKYREKFNYLIGYINLLADVCMDRNNYAIEFVQMNLPLAVISAVLVDDEIIQLQQTLEKQNQQNGTKIFTETNIHEPFLKIAHHAYVNNQKFSPIKRIKKIRSWYKLYEQQCPIVQQINKTKRVYQGQKQQEQKMYLKYLRDYIKEFLQKCDQNKQNLQILNTVLNLLKQTIILGLWDQIQNFRQLIPSLVMRILKIDSMNNSKQSLRLNRPQKALLIDCKIKATQIFKYISQMQIDIRLRYLMIFFQGLYDASENFQIYNIEQKQFQLQLQDQQQKQKVIERNNFANKEFFKLFGSIILGDVKKVSQDQDIMLKENIWYNKLKKMIPLQSEIQLSINPQTAEKQFQFDQSCGGDRNLFKYSQSFPTIILSLFQLSGYENKNLLNSSLAMLRAMFAQRKDLIENFNQMLICGKGNLNQVYLTLKFMRNKFNILQNHSVLKFDGNINKSFPYALWKPYDHLSRQQSKRSGIIQDLFFLARTLKDNISLKNIQSLMHVQQQVFRTDIVYNFYTQRQRNNSLFQQLNMAEGIYKPLISYIKLVGDSTLTQIHRRVLFSIYQYLTLLCFNNMKAKHILMRYIPDVLKHLKKKVGVSSFIYEVCNNNKLLVNNQDIVKMIIQKSLDACISLEVYEQVGVVFSALIKNDQGDNKVVSNDYEKSRILYCLRGVLLFGDQGHKRNQAMLMDKLQDNRYRHLIHAQSTQFKAGIQKFDLNSFQSYITTHFQIFSALVQSQNLINIGKLQNLHSYIYCLKCLSQAQRWQLRRALRSYVNRLYYINKDRDIFMFQQFIRQQFTIINKQLQDLIQLHQRKYLTQDLKVKNGVRFTYALSQINLFIIQILITLHEMFLKPEFIKLLKREINKANKNQSQVIHDQLIQLLKKLGCIYLLYPKNKPISPFIKQIKRLMTQVFKQTFHVRYLQKKSQPSPVMLITTSTSIPLIDKQKQQQNTQQSMIKKNYTYDHSRSFFRNLVQMIRDLKSKQKLQKLKDQAAKRKNQINMSEIQLKENYIEVIFSVPDLNIKPLFDRKINKQEEFHYKPHLQTAHSKIFRVLAKPDLEENQQNIQLNKRLSSVKQLMQDSPIFKKLKDDQFYNLVQIFKHIDQTQPTHHHTKQPSSQPPHSTRLFTRRQIITNIFTLIMNNPTLISDQQKIFIIKLIRCYISDAVEQKQNYKLSVDKWNAEYYSDETSGENEDEKKSELVRRQHEIEQCGGSMFIVSIFKENLANRVELLNEALLLGIVYLYNGNKQCQRSLLTCLTQDPQNLMLISMKSIISFIGNFLIQVRKMKDYQKIRSFAYKSVDSYDYFNMQQKTLTKAFGHNNSDKFQIQTQLNFELALCRSFRFLQLFCENNNIQMKNFLLMQVNQDGNKKTNSINFVAETCLLIRKFFKIMNNKVVGIPLSLLDFINQITQIPCIDTQLSLLNSTFFEDISYMAGFFQSKQNIRQRKFNFVAIQDDDPLNQLEQIYQKGIGLALSNFEGNDKQIVWQFLNKAQPKYLWIVMKQNLIKMLKQKAEKQYGINRDQIDKQFQIHFTQADKQYRQFLTEQLYIKKLFMIFSQENIKKLIEDQKAKDKIFRDQICNIINVIAILKKIDDYAAEIEYVVLAEKENVDFQQNNKAVKARNFRLELISIAQKQYKYFTQFLDMFQSLVLQIQVASYNGKQFNLQNLYFPNHPVFQYLAPDSKDTIMFQVSRDTPRDKLISLLGNYQNVKQQIEWNYSMKYYSPQFLGYQIPLSITSSLINQIRVTARYVSYLICLLMLYFIVVDHDKVQKTSYFTYYNYNDKLFMKIICGVQLTLTVVFFTLWLKMRSYLSWKKYMDAEEENEDEAAEELQIIDESPEEEEDYSNSWIGKIKIIFKPVKSKLTDFSQFVKQSLTTIKSKLIQNIVYQKLISPIVNFIINLFQVIAGLHTYESGFLSILVFVISSFLGNFIGVQWYTMHIFDFFVGISLLTNVFKAILNNIKLLTLLSGLAGCFILVFNVISLNTYIPVIYQQQVPQQSCQDFLGCVLQLYTSGAIGDDMDQLYIGRFVFDTLYVVFMQMIFQGLVGGMIIDSFMGLKEEDAERDADKKTFCYICGMEKANIQKSGSTFTKHTSHHFLWNYLFYIYCLKLKDQTDYTGIQYTITNKINQEDVTWFPDNGQKDMSGEIKNLVIQLKQRVGQFKGKIQGFNIKAKQTVDFVKGRCLEVYDKSKMVKEEGKGMVE